MSGGFSADERAQMLALKGVGTTVIDRLEQILMGSTCWHNSPQARAAISGIIALAGEQGT